ncbi:transglutaminase domain-containing protein [uncultured Winogradskyella sp.]|uniref:transglutaminase domain-containing protein n=1 Tax=uncultured Winogradskyella sp. TaxID=395353 RepID=UPI0026205DB8|nr:transglutaminase domain-containing protein [uncultured Winogradskyella sp.]
MKIYSLIITSLFSIFSYAQIQDFKSINFEKADNIALVNKGENLYNLPDLTYKLTDGLTTDVEKFRAIYVWVCQNIANDYGLYHLNKSKRERFKNDSIKFNAWTTKFRKKLFKKLLNNKRTICTGYAYMLKTLCDLADLECEIIQGYGRVSTTNIENLELPNHSWNAIKLNGKWYLCDPTWASGIPDPETNNFTYNYNDGFFLANPKLFAINHFPIDHKWWLLDDEVPTFRAFLASPIIYGSAYKHLDQHGKPKQMHHVLKKGEALIFEYLTKTTLKKSDVRFYIDSGYNQWKTEPTSQVISGKTLLLKHQFKSKGYFDVHLYLKENLIATYTVEVK